MPNESRSRPGLLGLERIPLRLWETSRGLRMSYNGIEAVKGIDLRVSHGEIFAFLGPNGAGKTGSGSSRASPLTPGVTVVGVMTDHPRRPDRPPSGPSAKRNIRPRDTQPQSTATREDQNAPSNSPSCGRERQRGSGAPDHGRRRPIASSERG